MFERIKKIFKRDHIEVINLETFGGDWDTVSTAFNIIDKNRKEKKRIPKNPIDIIDDLEMGVKFPTKNIKEGIAELKRRQKFVNKNDLDDGTDEQRAIEMLQARLKYPKYAHMFRWRTTNQTKIQQMLDKYELECKDIKFYMRNIPAQAISSMELYAAVLKKVTRLKPAFSLIAPAEYFKDPKNDPILLAKSPFGEYFYILGAWDKEISLVGELLNGEEFVKK